MTEMVQCMLTTSLVIRPISDDLPSKWREKPARAVSARRTGVDLTKRIV
jgi:hypothetical protein